jgi:type II secretory pathway component GspD/PulD (secretin)
MTRVKTPKLREAMAVAVIALGLAFSIGAAAPADSQSAQSPQPGPQLSITDVPVRDLLQTLAKQSGVNILMTEDVTGNVTVQVTDEPFEEILAAVCDLKGLRWKRRDNGLYMVYAEKAGAKKVTPAEDPAAFDRPRARGPNKIEIIPMRFWDCGYMAYQFDGWTQPRNPGLLRTPQMPSITGIGEFRPLASPGALWETSMMPRLPGMQSPPTTAGNAGAAAAQGEALSEQHMQYPAAPGVGTGFPGGVTGFPGGPATRGGPVSQVPGAAGPLGTLLPQGLEGPPIAYLPLNALIVVGDEEAIKEFRELVSLLDVKVRQVKMEIQLVSVSLATIQGWGLQWGWAGGNTSVTLPTEFLGPAGISIAYTRENLWAKLQAAVTATKARVIQAFTLTTLNNFPASIQTVNSFPFVTSSGVVQPGIGGGQVVTGSQVNYVTIPAVFQVVPTINADDTISAYLTPVFTSLGASVPVPGGGSVPRVYAQSAFTLARVKNGETFVIGGTLLKNWTKSLVKVPLLSEIPVLGPLLFTKQDISESNDEVFFFVTPRIQEEEQPGALTTVAIP